MSGTTIEHRGRLLARVIRFSDWSDGLTFYSAHSDYVQVGSWRYQEGVELRGHYHLLAPRSVDRTQEVVVVLTGSLEARISTEAGEEVARLILFAGDAVVMLAGAHAYTVLAAETRVLEVKNGPYVGADLDRAHI